MASLFLLTLLGIIPAQLSPGPNLVAVAGAALAEGRRAGVVTALGIACGIFIWALAVALGLGGIFTAYPVSFLILKLVGGAYLLWLGIKALRAALRPGSAPRFAAGATREPDHARFRRGLFVVLTNPKAALMWGAVATFLFGAGLTTLQVASFAPIGAATGFAIYGGYAWLFSTCGAGALYRRFARVVKAAFGLAFGAFGLMLLASGLRSLRP